MTNNIEIFKLSMVMVLNVLVEATFCGFSYLSYMKKG